MGLRQRGALKLLLDTHVFLWLVTQPEKVSPAVLDAYHDRSHEIFLSVVSAWEAQIKVQAGELREVTHSLREILTVERERRNVELLGVELAHGFALGELHRLAARKLPCTNVATYRPRNSKIGHKMSQRPQSRHYRPLLRR